MDLNAVLVDLYGRIPPLAAAAVADLSVEQLIEAPRPGANTIAWLVWHLTRVQDHHISELLESPQLWVEQNWSSRFGLAADEHNTGYGHSPADVATVRPAGGSVLVEYLDAVSARTTTLLESLNSDDLDRIVDRRWDPPVTMGVRLVSVADDCLQHVGQAAYVRGLLDA
jgi:hypothetical protein